MKPPISDDSPVSHGSRMLFFVILGVIVALLLAFFLLRTPVSPVKRPPVTDTPIQH